MPIPTLDARYPLCALPLGAEKLPLEAPDATVLLQALVRQAMYLVRSSQGWERGKLYGTADARQGGRVQSLHCPSGMDGRLSKCAWHARLSKHVYDDAGLSFDDFFRGLGSSQHTTNESQYIPDLTEAKRIAAIVPGRAEVWQCSCERSNE